MRGGPRGVRRDADHRDGRAGGVRRRRDLGTDDDRSLGPGGQHDGAAGHPADHPAAPDDPHDRRDPLRRCRTRRAHPPARAAGTPSGWESFQVGADGRTLVFTYYAGVAPCSVFDSINAVEGPTQVTVTIYERSDVGPDVACIAMAQQKSATVTLGADLGGRTVVDGGR